MNAFLRASTCIAAVALAACAHTPPVTVTYYQAQSEASFKVVRTVACDDADHVVVASTVTPTVKYQADRSKPASLPLARLQGPMADTDFKVDFYDDGRLKGVNASATGQGEAVLKAAIATAQFALSGNAGRGPPKFPAQCKLIKSWNSGKPVTITYESTVDHLAGTVGQLQPIPPQGDSAFYAEQLAEPLGVLCAVIQSRTKPQIPAAYTAKGKNEALLALRQPGRVAIDIKTGPVVNCQMETLWSGEVLAGQDGAEYFVPIPKAPMFGKQVFAVSLAESGALTSLQYASNTGSGQALNALNAALTAGQGPTDAERAAQLKAEADIIAAQSRLVQCKANPASCK